MDKIRTNTRLVINSYLKIELEKDQAMLIYKGKTRVRCGSHGLAIIEQFYKPNTISNALKKLKSRSKSTQQWMDLTSTIMKLYKSKLLIEENQKNVHLSNSASGYSSASFHIRLLNDKTRTSSFIHAIKQSVKTGDIVVDIGTGTGVLAIAAAKYGASHVYAVEPSDMGELAKKNFEKNGVADRITLIKGYSSQVDLPEKVDLLISEVIGNEPLAENILEIFSDAFKRFLKPAARCIPKDLRIYGIPVDLQPSIINRHFFEKTHTRNWHKYYGIDFSHLENKEKPEQYSFYTEPYKARNWRYLGKPALLSKINLNSVKDLVIQNTAISKIDSSGKINGILIFFDIKLSKDIDITTNPLTAAKENSWYCKVWLLPKPINVKNGQKIKISYNYRVPKIGNTISITTI